MKDFLSENFGQGLGLSTGISGSLAGARTGASLGSDLLHGPNVSGEIGNISPSFARGVNRVARALGLDEPYSEEDIDLMEQMAGWGFTPGRATIDFTASTTPKISGVEPYSHYYAGAGLLGATISVPHNSLGFEYTLHTGPQLGLRLGNTTIKGSLTKSGIKDLLGLTEGSVDLSVPSEPFDGTVTIDGIPETSTAGRQEKDASLGVEVSGPVGLGTETTTTKTRNRSVKAADVNVDLLRDVQERMFGKDAVLDLGKWGKTTARTSKPVNTSIKGSLLDVNTVRAMDEKTARQVAAANAQSRAAIQKNSPANNKLSTQNEEESLDTLGLERSVDVTSVDMVDKNAVSTAMTQKNNVSQNALGLDLGNNVQNSKSGVAAAVAAAKAAERSRDAKAEKGSQAARDWGKSISERMAEAKSRANDLSLSGYERSQANHDLDRLSGESKAQQRAAARSAKATTASTNDKTGGKGEFGRHGELDSVSGQKANANQTNKARNKDGSYSLDADGNGAGDAGGTVICTELYRQGLLSYSVYRADQRFGMRLMRNDPYAISGYHFWAKPVVRLMRKSKLFTNIINKSVGQAWAKEMAVREGLDGVGTLRGKLVVAVGVPMCRMIGYILDWVKKPEEKTV